MVMKTKYHKKSQIMQQTWRQTHNSVAIIQPWRQNFHHSDKKQKFIQATEFPSPNQENI